MSHHCQICNMSFKSKIILERHKNTNRHKNQSKGNTITYKCDCGKFYAHHQSFYRHKRNCHYDEISGNNNEPEQIIQVLKEENNKMREEMDELRKQVEMLMEKSTGNITNNNSNSNNNNTHIETQNIILVNSFGNENTDYLTDQIITKLIKNNGPATCIPKIIESIHFDPEHPENHNIKVTNQKNNYAKVIKENKWVTVNKKRTIENMI